VIFYPRRLLGLKKSLVVVLLLLLLLLLFYLVKNVFAAPMGGRASNYCIFPLFSYLILLFVLLLLLLLDPSLNDPSLFKNPLFLRLLDEFDIKLLLSLAGSDCLKYDIYGYYY